MYLKKRRRLCAPHGVTFSARGLKFRDKYDVEIYRPLAREPNLNANRCRRNAKASLPPRGPFVGANPRKSASAPGRTPLIGCYGATLIVFGSGIPRQDNLLHRE